MESPSPFEQRGSDGWLVGGGMMGQLIRAMDWAQTPLGPIETWPPSLRTTVSLALNSNFPISLAWGPQHTQIYNDGYWPICGDKHPHAMGQDFSECWASAWPAIGEAFESALAGTTAFLEDQRMFLDRLGYLEETFFTFSFSPIRDESGEVVGLFHPVTETTSKMIGQRRTRILRDLAAHGLSAQSLEDGIRLVAQTLAEAALDLPFVLFYQLDADGHTARRIALTGLTPDTPATPATIDLTQPLAGWPLAQVAADGQALQLIDVRARFGDLCCDPYPEPIASACIQAITPPGHTRPACIMVAGASTRLPINETYAAFFDLVAAGVTTVVANAIAHETERQRAEALAEIDRAKTVFFSNVSHEFRTPLTLLIGPLEDELADRAHEIQPARRERLEIAHRNSLRLLKLVNSLLDFARIEAGRAEAVYQPTDLAALTRDLAGNFRSACERAGLQLHVDCPPLAVPVYVDHDMWEKMVLNLLSNAFKFTLSGAITIRLTLAGDGVELTVQDTGVGIPPDELPLIFDRFHRVRGTQGRTHEGTGIGLALVQELTSLHGGVIRAASVLGEGSTFTLAIPFGTAHLPADRIGAKRVLDSTALGATPFVAEALRWLPNSATDDPGMALGAAENPPRGDGQDASDSQWSVASHQAPGQRARIVWADDNADMRDYVARLLSEHYDVEAVGDGAAALAAVRRHPADLVLSDVMMPRLDGFGLLRALRADIHTRTMPIILLSARAGDEARVEGIQAEADDYLVKPFSARELLARIGTQLELARLRRASAAELEQRVAERTAALAQATRDLHSEVNERRHAELALRESERQYRLLFDTMLHGSVYQDRSGKITAMNPAAERILGQSLDALRDQTSTDLERETRHADGSPFPGREHPSMVALRTGQPVPNTVMRVFNPREQAERWINVSAVPLFHPGAEHPYQVYTIFEDITDRKRAEQALERSAARLRVLSDASRAFAAAVDDYQALLDLVARTNADQIQAACTIRMISDDGQWLEIAALGHYDPDQLPEMRASLTSSRIGIEEHGPAATAVRLGEPQFMPVIDREAFKASLPPEQRAILTRFFPHSIIVMPLRLHGRSIGSLMLARDASEQPSFDMNDLRLAQDLADRAALAISNARLLAQVHYELAERARAEHAVRQLNAELEQRVESRTAELTAANKELEAFSYSISHDLRAPLRAIDGFARILLDEYIATLPDEAQHYFALVQQNAQQMGRLIDDLLAFSRLSRQPLAKRSIAMGELVRECLATLQEEFANRSITLQIAELANCQADPALLKQVWINLLANALKYTRRRDPAVITIDSQVGAGEITYTIRDNGVGFDMRYSNKLFGVFQRLHRAEDYEGTGVGLAIVQRIIHRHGGRIWAEAAPNQGATFFFTLTAQPG